MDENSEKTRGETAADGSVASIETIRGTLDKFLEAADVSAAYGAPIKNGDAVIIPAAEVLSGMGFGMGYGGGEGQEGEGGSGFGGGGGGRVLTRPVAVIIATPDEVRVEPVVDITKIALAALTASGFMMGLFIRMMKGSKEIKES